MGIRTWTAWGDKINIIKPGKNYGWPVISYGLADTGGPLGGIQQEGMEQPVYYYEPSISPCGMTFYTGNLMPEWKNNLFAGALRGTHIIRFVINNETNGSQRRSGMGSRHGR